ncbi:MAG TPA: PIG-L family deacetylase [Tepidisphaeraceae bacterium]|jgi:LmbE family N-acetylglucosaminyl deacetylase|nr:PIG-L family deacetylase [Tepidisphaeraceae bacterium]
MTKVSIDQLSPPPPQAVLYVFAHQDDEMFVLPKMILEVKRGNPVHAVWITDGGKSADPKQRQEESIAAMELIGVPRENLHFLGYRDSHSFETLRPAYDQAIAVAEQIKPAQVMSPAYEGGNIDHDVANLIAATVASHTAPHPTHLEYPLYNRSAGKRRVGVFLPRGDPGQHLDFDAATRDLTEKASKVYRSQRLALWIMGFVADKNSLAENGPPYRVAPAHDFMQRPTNEPTDYERSWFHPANFSDWQKYTSEFLNSVSGEK